jgi:hypothetical protein
MVEMDLQTTLLGRVYIMPAVVAVAMVVGLQVELVGQVVAELEEVIPLVPVEPMEQQIQVAVLAVAPHLQEQLVAMVVQALS